jgi:hypothetical protein
MHSIAVTLTHFSTDPAPYATTSKSTYFNPSCNTHSVTIIYFSTSFDANTFADVGSDFAAFLNARATTNIGTYFGASCNAHTVGFAGTNRLADLVPDATADGSAMCP